MTLLDNVIEELSLVASRETPTAARPPCTVIEPLFARVKLPLANDAFSVSLVALVLGSVLVRATLPDAVAMRADVEIDIGFKLACADAISPWLALRVKDLGAFKEIPEMPGPPLMAQADMVPDALNLTRPAKVAMPSSSPGALEA